MSMLSIRGIGKHFGGLQVLQDVNIEVPGGAIFALIGPNGAGKTTVLRMLAGILTPTAGCVSINGLDLHAQPLIAKRRIGFLSGDTQLYPRLTPREVLRYFGRLYGMATGALSERIDQLVGELELDSFAGRPCRTLSTGQKQRVSLARAFLHQPEVLMLDEPSAALDVVSGQFITEAIRRERAAGRAVLFSTHSMSEAECLCDRILLLHAGRVVEQGTLVEILARADCANLTDAFIYHARRPREAVAGRVD